MFKKSIVFVLAITMILATAVPFGTAFAAERTTYSFNSATYGGSHNMYSSFSALGENGYADFQLYIEKAGVYRISALLGSDNMTTIKPSTDDTIGEGISVDTGGTSTFKEYVLLTANLKEGYNKFRITNTTNIITISNVYVEVAPKEAITFPKSEGAFKAHCLPGVVEGEDFDISSATSVYSNKILKQSYRKDSPLTLVNEGGVMTVSMDEGDTVEYTLNVLKSSCFDVNILANNTGKLRLYFDDSQGYVEAQVGGFEEKSFGTVYLNEGEHKLTLKSISRGMSLDKIRFNVSKNSSCYSPSDLVEGKAVIIEPVAEQKEQNPVWKTLYVSPNGSEKGIGTKTNPFDSIETAKTYIRKISADMKGDIIVEISSGVYNIDKKIEFTLDDSGKNGYNIVYRAMDADNKPVISGGRKIDGWQKLDDNIWYAKTDDDIEVVRQLYIDGYAAMMARSKYVYKGIEVYDDPMTEFKEDGFYIKKKNFPVLTNTEDIDLLFSFDWALSYLPVKSITDEGDTWLIKYDQPYFGRYYEGSSAQMVPAAGVKLHISNAPELMDEPGEFYFDKNTKTVYYYAYEGEDLSKSEAYTPQSEGLMDIRGNGTGSRISNLVFDNIDFRFGAWNDVARTGISNFQSDSIIPPDMPSSPGVQRGQYGKIPTQIEINFADNIKITNCNFGNMGSTALAMRDFVTNSEITGNYIHDIAGSGIIVGHTYFNSDNRTPDTISKNVTVSNNVLRRIGLDYIGCVGIGVFYANSVDILHNDIKDTSYTGISVGWGWGSQISNTLECGQHLIANNRIDYTGLAAWDGASIYTLSEMKGTYIEGNHMSNSDDSGGIYFDDGTRSVTARDNVMEDNKKNAIFKGIYSHEMYRNYANYVDLTQYVPWRLGPADKVVMEKPIRTEGDNWSDEAKAIMANAGLESEYKYLLNSEYIEYPSWRNMSIKMFDVVEFDSPTEYILWGRDFMEGGEGVAYHDTTAKGPTTYADGGIGDTVEGEWVKYKFSPKKAGIYDMIMYYSLAFTGAEANASDSSAVTVTVDGYEVCTDLGLENTGSWDSEKALSLAEVDLDEGEHEIVLKFSKGSFALGRFQFENEETNKTDETYDDGRYFKPAK